MKRLPPSKQTRETLRRMLAEGTTDDPRSSAMLLGMQLIFEDALEQKVADILRHRQKSQLDVS